MSRCSNLIFGLLLATGLWAQAHASQFSGNMFLNGEYQNGIKSHPKQTAHSPSNIFLEHAVFSRQASPFAAPTYLPPLEYLKCTNGQQCVRQEQCQGGYYTKQVPKIQNCSPETDICCTYRPPPTTTTTTTTTPKPYVECSGNTDCVQAQNCRNGEIVAKNYIKGQNRRCYSPDICCRLPSTQLTEDGYVLHVPKNPLVEPTSQYTPRPQTPSPYVPSSQRPTSYYPQPTQTTSPARQPQPTQPQRYTPPTQPQRYTPPSPATQPQRYTPPTPPKQPQRYTPPSPPRQPSQPAPPSQPTYTQTPVTQTRYPAQPTTGGYVTPPVTQRPYTTTPRTYLPPTDKVPVQRPQPERYPTPTPDVPVYAPQPSNENPQTVPLKGSSILSLPIVPPQQGSNVISQPTYAKCASALECTSIDYCNAIGVISETPVQLSPMQQAFRVPLTDCLIAATGQPGKCCRDPNYVDPWPVNMKAICACHERNTNPKGIADIDANFAEIPWQAMILQNSNKTLLCGATIVGKDHVLTTASCLKGVALDDLRIKAGEWKLGSTDEPLPFQLVNAASVNIHPDRDLAIIKLKKSLVFASHVMPICISEKDPEPNEQCITSGWGQQALRAHQEGAIMHRTDSKVEDRSACGADATGVCNAPVFDACEFDAGSALACGNRCPMVLKGIYGRENACGEGQSVQFVKPDVKWINAMVMKEELVG